jgi:diguanylate cyclase (GGDEF)-like protein
VKNRAIRFLSTDAGKITTLAVAILLLALGGVVLGRIVSANMLRSDAQSTSSAWASTVVDSIDDIPAVIAGAAPSSRTERLLNETVQVGDIYRFRIWSRTGRLVFTSERIPSIQAPPSIAKSFGERVAESVLSGAPATRAQTGSSQENPASFAVSLIPIQHDGVVIGVLEVYLDQTGDTILYRRSFLFTEAIIAIAVLLAGGIPGFMVYRRMAAHRATQAEALFLSEHDSLTGIPNRKYLGEAAMGALSWTQRNKSFVAALLIDVDRFKDINDSFGHSTGDEVLREFARRLTSAIRKEDMVARLGGDEFVVMQVGMAQPSGAAYLANRLMDLLSEPYYIEGSELSCRASIGVAIAPTDASEWDKLLSCADAALYKSKAAGRNTVCFFEAGMDAIIRERWRLEKDLRRALDTNAFQLAYQPLFSFRDRSLTGFEALLRWPEGWEPQSPAEFIPIAEESGLIVPIGAWVLKTACTTAAAWAKPMKVAVNLSPVQFRHGDVVATVREALDTSGLDPAYLELEVTESIWIQNTDAVLGILGQLRALGVSIALDDFGTGYSSLTYLWKFPFDKVKIDRSFVVGMNQDTKAVAIVNTIIGLGKALDMTITAEGVETEAQAQILREAGCDQAQGYLFSRPLPVTLANELANGGTAMSARGAEKTS